MPEQDHPAEWRKVRVGSAYSVTSKPRSLRYADHERIPFVPMNLIPQSGATEPRFIEKHPDEMTSGTYFERGDLLVARITPSFENGKQAIPVRIPQPFGVATTEVIPLQAIPDLGDVRYLFYYLLLADVRHSIAAKMEGSTGRQRVPESVLLGQEILLPPLPEQRAIAVTLDRVQAAVETETKRLRLARELKQAALAEVFTHGLRGEKQRETECGLLPLSWQIMPLKTVADFKSGGTPDKGNSDFWNGRIPWATPKDMKRPRLADAMDHISESGLEAGSSLVSAKTLLVVIRGMILARDVPVALTEVPMAFNQDMKAILPQEGLNAEYALYAFDANKQRLFQLVGMSAHGTRTLASSSLEEFVIPIPHPDEQRDIAELFRDIDARIARHEARQKLLRELFASLLRDLMTGRRRVVEVIP